MRYARKQSETRPTLARVLAGWRSRRTPSGHQCSDVGDDNHSDADGEHDHAGPARRVGRRPTRSATLASASSGIARSPTARRLRIVELGQLSP